MFTSLVVGIATNVLVEEHGLGFRRRQVLEEALHALVVQGFRLVCLLAGDLHLLGCVLGREVQDAQAGTKSLFGMLAGDQEGLDQLPGV